MGTALELLNDIKAFDLMATVTDVIQKTNDGYIEKQQAQMLEGKGKNRNIGRYWNPTGVYAQFKSSLNPLAGLGNVDLRLTGAFFDGMELKLTGQDIDIFSTDSKAGDLTEKYGGQIWGLNEKRQNEYNEEVFLPALGDEIEKQTGLKME